MRVIAGTDFCIATAKYETDRAAIRAALAEIVASHWFRNTKRCKELLQFVVGETLAGHGGELNERSIGVSVFGRSKNYDTNEDSVVRTSALEVRKRLAQYYHELEHETAVRIEMTPGGYAPEFRLEELAPAAVEAPRESSESPEIVNGPRRGRLSWPVIWGGVAVLLGAAILGAVWLLRPADPLEALWGPMLKGGDSLIVAVGAGQINPPPGVTQIASTPPMNEDEPSTLDMVRTDRAGFADAVVLAEVSGLLESRGRHVEVRRASSLTLDDLRRKPAVFVGNSPWTERFNDALRFRVERDPAAGSLEITDREKGGPTAWKVNMLTPYARRSQDWAVITRMRDPRTQQPVLLLCGLGSDGTAAAGELISQPRLLEVLTKQAPAGWQRKDFQVVVGVDLINGNAGPPHIVATYFW